MVISQLIQIFQIPTLYPAFITGYILYRYKNRFSTRYTLIAAVGFLLWSVYIFYSYFCNQEGFVLPLHFPMRDRLIDIVGRIGGAIFFFSTFSLLPQRMLKSKSIQWIGSIGTMTLGIYILQVFVLERGMSRYINLDSINTVVSTLVWCPLLSILVMVVSVLLIKLIQRNKVATTLLLGN